MFWQTGQLCCKWLVVYLDLGLKVEMRKIFAWYDLYYAGYSNPCINLELKGQEKGSWKGWFTILCSDDSYSNPAHHHFSHIHLLSCPKLISVIQSGVRNLFSGKASCSDYAKIMKFSSYVIHLLMIVKYVVLAFLLFLFCFSHQFILWAVTWIIPVN